MKNIYIPSGGCKYILLQRTDYFWSFSSKNLLAKILRNFFSLKFLLYFESLFKRNIQKKYYLDMKKEFNNISSLLPKKATNILDIGSGLAGIDLFFSQFYNNEVNLYLFDKNDISTIFYGYKERGAYYNSLTLSRELLEINGVPSNHIYTQEAESEIGFDTEFDIVISLISWGFHYPIDTYFSEVYNKLNKGGIVILDIRKGTGGYEKFKSRFKRIAIVGQDSKSMRIVATKD